MSGDAAARAPRRTTVGSVLALLRRLTLRRVVLLAETGAQLVRARLLVSRFGGTGWQRALGSSVEPSTPGAAADDVSVVDGVAWSVRIGSRLVPWRAVCLQQAIAATCMLRRRGVPSRALVGGSRARDGRPLDLHAWVLVNGSAVVGQRESELFVPIVAYDAGDRRSRWARSPAPQTGIGPAS